MQIKKATLIGLGAIGSFFAPGLYSVLGDNFRVMAQGERKERLEKNGVTINGVSYKFPVIGPDTEGDPSDLIIIAVKDYSLDEAISQIRNQVSGGTIILAALNGIDSEERVSAVYGWEHVLYSSMNIPIEMKDGVADFDQSLGGIRFGEARNDTPSGRVLAVQELFDKAGIRYFIKEDMLRCIWEKFMCNVGENLTCALLGIPYGAFSVSGHVNALRVAAMREVVALAKAAGIQLDEEDIGRRIEATKRVPPDKKPSTLQDIENGRQTEIELFAGKATELGRKYGIPTPVNEMFFHSIKALEEKNAGKFRFI